MEILKVAKGENPNAFYFVNETAKPIISESATLSSLNLKPSFLIDIPTQIGKFYSLINN
jgi:alpha-L-fucosidase 2